MSKSTKFFTKNKEYKVKGVNYHRSFPLKGTDHYKNGLLFISPYEDVRISVVAIPNDYEISIMVEKYDSKNERFSLFYGDISRNDLIILLGME